jgi:hypothetical protein
MISHPVLNDTCNRSRQRSGKLLPSAKGEVHGSFMFSLDAFPAALRFSNPGKQAMWAQIVLAVGGLL